MEFALSFSLSALIIYHMHMERILSQRPDVAWKEIDGQIILMDLGAQKRVHRLNSVGSFIWTSFDGKITLEKILKDICIEFEVSSEVAKRDLAKMVERLEELGVLIGS